MDREHLLTQFHGAMLAIYDAARRLKPSYVPGDFRRMVNEMGGKAAADKLLAMEKPSDGFGTLLLRGKEALKLSVEYVVLQNPWRQLFEPEQLAIARRRLLGVGCELPPDDLAAPFNPDSLDELDGIIASLSLRPVGTVLIGDDFTNPDAGVIATRPATPTKIPQLLTGSCTSTTARTDRTSASSDPALSTT